jgi:trk system potassium uptake protein TrkH
MRFFAIQRIIGVVLALSAIIMLPPAGLSWWFDDGIGMAFVESFLISVGAGLLLWWPVRRYREELRLRDGFLVTTATWALVSLICALPFVLGPTKLSMTDAYFESVSGLTTTGATVIVGLDALPQSLLFYRQSLCFLGGMGIVILAIAILPMLRIGGSQLFRAETTGPVKDTKLTPRIGETARALWMVYVGLNALCATAFWLGGMNLFDAIGHAFSTIATGGFSTHDASMGYFQSPLLEAICVLFMFLGGVNFSLHYVAWHRATGSVYFNDAELKAYFSIALATSVVVAFGAYATQRFPTLFESLRHSIFHVVSNMTTTGFTTTGFADWPGYAPMLLILIGFVGGCSGSTSGGMKVARVLMLFRQGAREVLQLVHPRGRFLVKMGGLSVPGAVLAAVTGFCTLYVFSYVVMALILAGTGVDLVTAWSAVAACLNNMGPALGQAAMHFRDMNDASVWVCTFAMLLGRLEVFTVLVLFTPAFWKE